MAAREGYDSTVEYLADIGADINSKDNDKVNLWGYTTDSKLVLLLTTQYTTLPITILS